MSRFTIKVKDVEEFVRSESMLFASGEGKRFLISLHAGPNVGRYIIESKERGIRRFANLTAAVRYFNDI